MALAVIAVGAAASARAQQLGAEAPPPYLSIDTAQTGARLQVNFPPRAGNDTNRLLYRLSSNDDLVVDLQLLAGRDERPFPMALFVALLLDGQQVRFSLAGAPESLKHGLTLPAPGMVVHSTLSLPGQRLSPGLHNVELLLWRADGVPFPCWSFLAVKGELPAAHGHPGSDVFVRTAQGRRPSAELRLSSDPEPLFGPLRTVAPTTLGSLSLRAHLERPEREREPLELSLVALLDGAQVSFRGSGKAPSVLLGPGEAADAQLRVASLPVQSTGHQLIFFLLRRPSLQNLDGFFDVSFFPTRQVGGVSW